MPSDWKERKFASLQVYGEVAREVGPKRAKLKAAQENLAKKQAQLQTAEAQLASVLAAVQQLKDKYEHSMANKKALEDELHDLQVKLERAEKLVVGLAGEKSRWEGTIATLEARITSLPVSASTLNRCVLPPFVQTAHDLVCCLRRVM
jgi:dynein heavy chain, axonemal